jgi:hypothetical protein
MVDELVKHLNNEIMKELGDGMKTENYVWNKRTFKHFV